MIVNLACFAPCGSSHAPYIWTKTDLGCAPPNYAEPND